MPHAPRASFWAASLAQIVTRPLDEGDHFCGNEVVAYSPSRRGRRPPAYTLGHQFKGEGLDTSWDDPNCRSSFVGHFTFDRLAPPAPTPRKGPDPPGLPRRLTR